MSLKEAALGSKWGVGGIITGVGVLILASQIPHDTPGMQEFAGGAGLLALVAGVTAIARRYLFGPKAP